MNAAARWELYSPRTVYANGLTPIFRRALRVPRRPDPADPDIHVRILARYTLKEHVGPLVFALTTLTSLMLLNYIAKQFGQLVGKGLPWSVIGEFFLLSIPFTIAMTLPMAVLVSTLYAFSRLAAENEIIAMKASGISMRKVMVPVVIGAAVLAAGMLAFNDQILPRSNHRLRKLQSDIARKKPTFALREQVINEVQPGKFFLRANHLEESSNRMREVTIYDLSNPAARRTIYADSGDMAMSTDQRDLILTLFNGWMQEMPKDQPGQLNRLFYLVDRIRVKGIGNSLERSDSDTYKSDREMSICEMHFQYSNARRERALARAELERTLAGAAWVLAGKPDVTRETEVVPDTGGVPRTLSTAYCAVLGWIPRAGAVSEAEAAEPQAPARASPPAKAKAAQAAAVPGTGTPGLTSRAVQQPAADSTIRAARAAAAVSKRIRGHVPRRDRETTTPEMVPGALDAARARIQDLQRQMDSFQVEIEKKFALAAACVVFVLMGAPIALRFPRGGVGLTIGVSLSVFALYYIGLIGGEALANRSILSPFWAMWAANILFGATAAWLLIRMGREGSTSRGGDTGEMIDAMRVWFAKRARRLGLKVDRRHRA